MKKRLDAVLVEQGLVPTRSRARDAILRGQVQVDGAVATKAGAEVGPDARLTVSPDAGTDFVSRGALKLIAALDHFGFEPKGRIALDAGASTGGFTEVLLARGALKVYAADVGHGQLHPRLRQRADVVAMEGRDVRGLGRVDFPDHIQAITADLSFISLEKVLPALLVLAVEGCWLVALIKPQFEVGREAIGKGGVVKDPVAREAAADRIAQLIGTTPGWTVRGVIPSPIEGGSGNCEYLIGAVRDV